MADMTELTRASLKSQYHAALATLRQAIDGCPDALWTADTPGNPCWRIAYHALFYTHLYAMPDEASFRPWKLHQRDIQFMNKQPDGAPYTRDEIVEYWQFCDGMIDDAVDALDLHAPESGFSWYPLPKLEHQIISIRHIQHHAAQLGDRLRASAGVGLDWVGAGRSSAAQRRG